MTHSTRAAVFGLFLLGSLASACHGHSDDEEGAGADEYFYSCENAPAGVTIFATDEAYRVFVDKIAATGLVTDDTQAAQLTAPAADSTLSAATPPQFAFTAGTAALDRAAPARVRVCPSRRSTWARIWDRLSPIGTAWAHCPNVTGQLYLFQLTADGATAPAYSALLSVSTFTPTAAPWKKALAPLVGKKMKLTLARGVFSMGQIQLGPFVGATPVTFTVGM